MFAAPGTPGITAYRHPSKSGELLVPPSISGKYHLFYMIEKRFFFKLGLVLTITYKHSFSVFYFLFFRIQFSFLMDKTE